MSRRYEARFEKIDSSDELCVCHIDDIWNSQTYIPDRNYPIVLWTTGEDEVEYRLSIEDAEGLRKQLDEAIKEAKEDRAFWDQIVEIVSQYEKAGLPLTIRPASVDSAFIGRNVSVEKLQYAARCLQALGEIYIDYDSSDYNNSLLRLKW